MNLLSLCSGYGGLDLAVEHVTGARTVGWSEIDEHAATVMRTRFSDAAELGDLTARTDWPDADIITAGFPCQPVSHAGRRQGDADDRWLWDDVRDTVRLVGPRLVVVENVPGLATLGGPRVVGDLAALGYRVRWAHVRASDHGAPHRRERIFIVAAHPDVPGLEGPQPAGRHDVPAGGDRPPDPLTLLPTPNASLSNYDEDPAQFLERREQVRQRGLNGNGVGMPLGVAVKVDWAQYEPAIRRWEHLTGRPAPAPLDGRNLSARFVEWMMGLPDGWVTEPVPNRRHALRILGNGVVPRQAAAAVAALLGG